MIPFQEINSVSFDSNKKTIRLIEVHNPISALIAESASVQVDGINIEYDGFWSSSLTDSTSKGKAVVEAVDILVG